MTPELARLRKTFDSPACACPLRGPAVVNQAPAKSAPGLGPSGFHPHASGLRPARSACRLYRTIEGATLSPASRPGRPIPPGNQDRGRAGQQAGRCSSSRGSKCMAREIALQLPTAQAMMHTWSVDNCTARSGPCWGLARWTILRARTAAAQEQPSATKSCALGSARTEALRCPNTYMR
ncbi:hypothetical protein PshuTeo1_58110 (plasmid) [Pseudomonas hunanensis]|nr:hypothetical protein PshuTeo1_58110 [Pseudomonas hunanensis]